MTSISRKIHVLGRRFCQYMFAAFVSIGETRTLHW